MCECTHVKSLGRRGSFVNKQNVNLLLDALVAYLLAGAVSPGRCPFLTGPLSHPPILHPIALQWDEWADMALTRALEGGGRCCPPFMFFVDIKQTNGLIFTSLSVPDEK